MNEKLFNVKLVLNSTT